MKSSLNFTILISIAYFFQLTTCSDLQLMATLGKENDFETIKNGTIKLILTNNEGKKEEFSFGDE